MNRRLLFKTLGALAAGLFLPPIRAAKARIRRYVSPSWLTGVQHWEHVAIAESIDATNLSPEPAVAHVVCRVLNPAKASRLQLRGPSNVLGRMNPDVQRVFDRIDYDTKRHRKVKGLGPDD